MPEGRNPDVGRRARAEARNECRAIRRALEAHEPEEVHTSVHSARKSIRHLRSLLRLVERRLDGAGEADTILQELGDSLSALRDAHVVIATAEMKASDDGKRWLPVVRELTRRRDTLLEKTLAADPGLGSRLARIEHVAELLEKLDWAAVKPADLRRGLERSRRRVHKAARRADRFATPENLHRWRRRVRKLRMQLQVARKIAPAVAREATDSSPDHSSPDHEIKALHKLSDSLGERQDLEVLLDVVRRMPDLPDRARLLGSLETP